MKYSPIKLTWENIGDLKFLCEKYIETIAVYGNNIATAMLWQQGIPPPPISTEVKNEKNGMLPEDRVFFYGDAGKLTTTAKAPNFNGGH